jgi:hypothetical protein
MLRPVGELAPSVYWRRRIVLLAALILAVVTIIVLAVNLGGGSSGASPDAPPFSGSAGSRTTTPASSAAASQTPTAGPSTSAPAATSAAAKGCSLAQLTVRASSNAKTYAVGSAPVLSLLVTNTGAGPCVQDLADTKIELRVFSGSARIWGSHDCAIQPGVSLQTLPVGQPIRRDVEWSGLSSQPACAGVRQRVPAGTYTVLALLAGKQGAPSTFQFTG